MERCWKTLHWEEISSHKIPVLKFPKQNRVELRCTVTMFQFNCVNSSSALYRNVLAAMRLFVDAPTDIINGYCEINS